MLAEVCEGSQGLPPAHLHNLQALVHIKHPDVAIILLDPKLLGQPGVSLSPPHFPIFPEGIESIVSPSLGPPQLRIGKPPKGLNSARVTPNKSGTRDAVPKKL